MKGVQSIHLAIQLLKQAQTPVGFVASVENLDNYRRVWSRDAAISGIAGILTEDKTLIDTLEATVNTLALKQLEKGTIPSNVSLEGNDVSYGSAVGRVDATSWFIIATCLLIKKREDESLKTKYAGALGKALNILEAWEFNNKHLIYTPLSGNWADEYPVQGYLLYDNCLRLWGLKLYNDIYGGYDDKTKAIEEALINNFWFDQSPVSTPYFQPVYMNRFEQGHSAFFETGFSPAGYIRQFDAAGNGLAMMLFGNKVASASERISHYIEGIFATLGHNLVPAFWPVIKEGDKAWQDLKLNYAYSFKNDPGHFHNGGIWPVMMGIFCMGLATVHRQDLVEEIWKSYHEVAGDNIAQFNEYIDSNQFNPGGKPSMAFTASGIIFMYYSIIDRQRIKDIIP